MKNIIRRKARTFRNHLRYLIFRTKSRNLSISEAHFKFWSTPNHINRAAFETALREMGAKSISIIETGTAAWGTNSTMLWDAYVRKYGGSLISVDIRPEASERLRGQLSNRTKCEISDSVKFLRNNQQTHADLYFLDSWDVDWAKPEQSALHGLAEFEALPGNLKSGTLVLIDDTPASISLIPREFNATAQSYYDTHFVWPGKGSLVLKRILDSEDFEVVFQE